MKYYSTIWLGALKKTKEHLTRIHQHTLLYSPNKYCMLNVLAMSETCLNHIHINFNFLHEKHLKLGTNTEKRGIIFRRRTHITFWKITLWHHFILSVHCCFLRRFFRNSKIRCWCNLLRYILGKQRVSEYYYYCCYYFIFFHHIIVCVIALA
jgi:hypothetical protein